MAATKEGVRETVHFCPQVKNIMWKRLFRISPEYNQLPCVDLRYKEEPLAAFRELRATGDLADVCGDWAENGGGYAQLFHGFPSREKAWVREVVDVLTNLARNSRNEGDAAAATAVLRVPSLSPEEEGEDMAPQVEMCLGIRGPDLGPNPEADYTFYIGAALLFRDAETVAKVCSFLLDLVDDDGEEGDEGRCPCGSHCGGGGKKAKEDVYAVITLTAGAMRSRGGNYKGGQGAIKLTPEHADELAGFFAFSRYKAALRRVPKNQ